MTNIKFSLAFRLLSTCPAMMSKSPKSSTREARIMNKFVSASSKRRAWYPAKEITASTLPYYIHPQKGERNNRRINVLNKLFMKYVTDLMCTGELSTEIAGLGIEISKVKISPDFSMLGVYWVAKGTSIDQDIETILAKNAGKLKHELSQLRVIGNVPNIQFLKDKTLSKIAEIDAILSKADFGEDFEPTDPMCSLLPEFTLSTKLPPNLEKEVLDLDGGIPEESLPVMRMDVLGLDQDAIMQKVQQSMKKAQAIHRCPTTKSSEERDLIVPEANNHDPPPSEVNDVEMVVQNSDLRKFFAKRIAIQSKLLKGPKNYQPEKEILLADSVKEDDEEDTWEDDDWEDEVLDVTSSKFRRIKELEISLDDFEETKEVEELKLEPHVAERNVK